MPLKEDGVTPKELSPRCILPNYHSGYRKLSLRMFRLGIMLNAVDLSNIGAEALLEKGIWQQRTEPFFLSFMSVENTPDKRLNELERFLQLLGNHLDSFKAPVGLQVNCSCPNAGLNPDDLANIDEVCRGVMLAHRLRIPLMWKFNVLTPVKDVREICRRCNHHLGAICLSNTIHWDDLPRVGIDRQELFGTDISPLHEFGGGALSGKPLLPLVIEWLNKAKLANIDTHICAGGGIMSSDEIVSLFLAGADSVSLGCVGTLRPRRVQAIIRKAQRLFS
jgi:dihydroorotate dehydrogenase